MDFYGSIIIQWLAWFYVHHRDAFSPLLLEHAHFFNHFPNDKFQTHPNWKILQNSILNLMKIAEFCKRVEKTVEKGKLACCKQFLLFPQCFQKTCTADTWKQGLLGNGLTLSLPNKWIIVFHWLKIQSHWKIKKQFSYNLEWKCGQCRLEIRLHVPCSLILIYIFFKSFLCHQQ